MPQTFTATGLTCGHCVNAVTDEVGALPGVRGVTVTLGQDAPSQIEVDAERPLTRDEVAAALDEAGDYRLL